MATIQEGYYDQKYRLVFLSILISNEFIKLQKRLKLGEECCKEWKKFQLLVGLLEILKCYLITKPATNGIAGTSDIIGNKATATITYLSSPVGSGDVYINWYSVNNTYVTTFNNWNNNTTVQQIVNALNGNMPVGAIAVWDGDLSITISAPTTGSLFNGLTVDYPYLDLTDGGQDVFSTFSGGTDNIPGTPAIAGTNGITYTQDDNCLTQQQIDCIWNYISKKWNYCFPPYGSHYKLPSGDVVYDDIRVTNAGDDRETDNNNTRIV